MAGSSTTLVIRILADARQASKTFGQAATRAEKFGAGLRRAALPAAAVAAGLGLMAKSAADDARAQAVMANNLRRTTGATNAQVAAVEDYISATALATGVADDQLRPAMSSLARATGDVTVAQKAMGTVLDVSASTGKDTQAVADAVAKAYAGNTVALSRLVPGLDQAVLKSKDMNAIMGELARKTGGSAAAAADTAAGKWQRATVAFDEAKEGIGAGLLPVLSQLAGLTASAGGWAARHTGAVRVLTITLGSLAAIVLTTNAALKLYTTYTTIAGFVTKTFAGETKLATAATAAWAVAQRAAAIASNLWTLAMWGLNVAMDANPIGATIAIIVLLIAAIVLAYKKSDTFRRIVAAAWNGIKVAAAAAWKFIKSYVFLPYILYFKLWKAAAKLAIDAVIKIWEGLKAGFKAVWDWLKSNVFDPLINIFDKIVAAVQNVIDWIGKIKIPKAVTNLLSKVGNLFSVPAPIPPAPMPRSTTGRSAAPSAAAAGSGGADQAALASLSGATGGPQVIVQLADRKLADLIDVRIRANATAAARNLRRRSVVVV